VEGNTACGDAVACCHAAYANTKELAQKPLRCLLTKVQPKPVSSFALPVFRLISLSSDFGQKGDKNVCQNTS
jgi:hypothetical protein